MFGSFLKVDEGAISANAGEWLAIVNWVT